MFFRRLDSHDTTSDGPTSDHAFPDRADVGGADVHGTDSVLAVVFGVALAVGILTSLRGRGWRFGSAAREVG